MSLGAARVLYIYRTANGWLNECVSADGGESWTPRRVGYAAGGHVKGPRGPLTARRLNSGEFLLLYFNNGWPGYSGADNATRNPCVELFPSHTLFRYAMCVATHALSTSRRVLCFEISVATLL